MLYDTPNRPLVRRARRAVRRPSGPRCPRSDRRPAPSDTTARRARSGAGSRSSGIAGDQQSSLFGHACLEPGHGQEHLRDGLVRPDERRRDVLPEPTEGLLTHRGLAAPRTGSLRTGTGLVTHYALEGAIFVTGAAVQWLRDGLGIIDQAAEVGPLAASVDGTDGRGRGAGLHRSGRAVLGSLRPGHGARHHPRRRTRPPRPRRGRVDGVPDPRRRRCHGVGVGDAR